MTKFHLKKQPTFCPLYLYFLDYIMAIIEPLPQWEQGCMEYLIPDVERTPDDPDNPGDTEGIGSIYAPTNAVTIRPNPTGGLATVTCQEPILELTVCDMTGRTLMHRSGCGTTATIDTAPLHKGLYLVKTRTAKGTTAQKLAVK